MKQFNKKVLSATVSMLMTLTVCSSVSQASDIEIYSNATGGKTTITLMLDTSGSMSESQVGGSACELASGTTYTAGNEPSGTTPGYTKYFCGVDIPGSSSQRVYYYKRTGGSGNRSWFSCGASGSPNVDACTIPINDPDPNNSFEDTGSNPRYYYKNERPKTKHYDRLTRLKDAIFTLMDSNQIDSNSVAIGIGQFSSQSGSDNVFTSADGSSGKIVVPAALLSTAQRTAIKTAVANLIGSNGTPTANAYAEVAAYMLGTNTVTNITLMREEYISYSSGGQTRYGKCTTWQGLECYGYSTSTYLTSIGGRATKLVRWSSASDIRTALLEPYTDTATNLGYSGFSKSVLGSKVGSSSTATNYQTPLSTTNTQCNGQGIYFLTDGEPNSSPVPVPLMQAALGANGSSFSVPATGTLPNGTQAGHGMPAVGEFAKALRDKTKNPLGLEIKTAVVGFGSVFNVDRTADAAKPVAQRVIRTLDYINSKGVRTNEQRDYYNCSLITNVDAQNACNWGAKSHPDLPSSVGGYGEGGFYSAQSVDDVVNSVVKFLDEVNPNIEPVATGSPTIPIDSLNPIQLQPYGYYAEFKPKPSETTQLWAGNLNKYNLRNGELVDKNLQRLILSTGALNKDAVGLWTNGVKGQLPLGTLVAANGEQNSKRKVFTNRVIKADKTAVSGDRLAQVSLLSLFADNNEIAKFKYDADKNYWLNFLGYDVGIAENIAILGDLTSKTEYRELGSVMHSTPIMLTQEGKITVANGKLTTTGRKDYLMFGSTQGALHVVDDDGKEIFAFVPHEMMKNQKNAFIGSGKYTGSGKNNLFYGVDGPWTAHTQYVSKSDGTLTVKDSGRKASDEEDAQNLIGMQWVYGGLRMGGKSYYALDLTDIEKPELKFHINPDADNASAALKQMGQSWSKPTLAYVNWGDTRKLVMFVGGGYDPIYETHNADPSSTKGNGVYMFDAHNGDLLWWASDSEKTGASRFTQNNQLKYSVASQINAIDRDGDGLTDHLYFGDLGGQAFRVDFNNRAADTANFATRVVHLFTEHQGSGLSPRFYEMPSVSIHQDDGSYFAAVAFSSGNRSSPLAGLNSTVSANDAVFVVYDNDVARQDLYKSGITLYTENESLTQLNFDSGVARRGQNNIYNGGWKAYFDSAKAGRYKGMNDLYALDGMLYVNVYDRDGTGIGGNCGAGVVGDSYLYQYCLPTGKCNFYSGTGNKPDRVKLGAGILGTGLGQGYGNNANTVSLVVNRDQPSALDCSLPANKNLPQCQLFNTQVKLKQMRWYESR
ncbi:PilC/PilY family type IV pilus protein [Acinetobacter sp. WY4]|uniref:PilC/PilY family type IV pilus protein n=1 Tax=Acinetobacter sp. WY4 TaxID=2708348 RepID=UPI001E4B5719|nr:PilC/PilY family type IV pilus protein [Acinetobacter sp. WY4]